MPLVRDNGLVEDDRWVYLEDEAPLPGDGTPVTVSLERWAAEREALASRNAPQGVVLEAGEDVEAIAGDLDRFALIALRFPKFTDGRAYSSARLLRERYAYKGELRAVGNVLCDQLMFMHRCGFDSYEIGAEDAAEAWSRAIGQFSVWYQPTADGRPTAAQRRARRVEPAVTPCCAGNWAY